MTIFVVSARGFSDFYPMNGEGYPVLAFNNEVAACEYARNKTIQDIKDETINVASYLLALSWDELPWEDIEKLVEMSGDDQTKWSEAQITELLTLSGLTFYDVYQVEMHGSVPTELGVVPPAMETDHDQQAPNRFDLDIED